MGKRKNFIFHNKKAISQIEKQPNQSRYIEELVMKDCNFNEAASFSDTVEKIKNELLQSIQSCIGIQKRVEGNVINNNGNSISISNTLSLLD